jgi:hypothetical protein
MYKRTGVPREELLILAAGPIASLVWAIVCTACLALWRQPLHPVGQIALALGALEGVIALVYNGAAAVLPQLMAARPRSDGAKIQLALRGHRRLRKIEAHVGRQLTRAELREMLATKRIPPDALRERTSIPPPDGLAH